MTELSKAALSAISGWVDAMNWDRFEGMSRDEMAEELLLLHRTIKVAEELGECVTNLIGFTGANPRKGVTSTRDDIVNELLDVAVSALGAVEHIIGDDGTALDLLDRKIITVAVRAGLISGGNKPSAYERGDRR